MPLTQLISKNRSSSDRAASNFYTQSDVRAEINEAEQFNERLIEESNRIQDEIVSEDDECSRQMKRHKARELIKANKLKDAITILESMRQSQSKLVLLAECYLQVDQLPKARECVLQLRAMMTSEQRPPVGDVMELGNQFMSAGHTVRAMSLLACVSRLHSMDSKPDDAVVAIRNCSSMIDDVIRAKVKCKSNVRIVELGLFLMDEFIKDLRNVGNATPGIKADMEARCLCDIGLSSRASSKTDQAIDSFKLGIRLMKKQFGLNVFKFQIYGHLSNNLAIIYRLREQYGKALKHYNLCLKAYNNAIDWESTFLKNKRVQSTNVNMALLKKKSGEQ